MIRIHDIMVFIQEHYGKQYAENTRETIRRQTLHQFGQASLVVINPDDPLRPTNSPNNVYMIGSEALKAIKKFGTKEWKAAAQAFMRIKGSLADLYDKKRKDSYSSVELPNGSLLNSVRESITSFR